MASGRPRAHQHGGEVPRLLLLQANFQTPESTVVDVSDPLKPIPLCTLRPSSGGRFTSATTIAFWFEQHLGTADLASGAVAWTADLPVTVGPGAAALSADGSAFAYTIDSDTGTSTHLYVGRTNRTLFTEPMLGGHGGPPYSPVGRWNSRLTAGNCSSTSSSGRSRRRPTSWSMPGTAPSPFSRPAPSSEPGRQPVARCTSSCRPAGRDWRRGPFVDSIGRRGHGSSRFDHLLLATRGA